MKNILLLTLLFTFLFLFSCQTERTKEVNKLTKADSLNIRNKDQAIIERYYMYSFLNDITSKAIEYNRNSSDLQSKLEDLKDFEMPGINQLIEYLDSSNYYKDIIQNDYYVTCGLDEESLIIHADTLPNISIIKGKFTVLRLDAETQTKEFELICDFHRKNKSVEHGIFFDKIKVVIIRPKN